MKDSDQIYWIKSALAIVTGALTMISNTYFGVHDTISVLIGIAIYFAISEIMSMIKNIDRNRTMRIGIGAFLFIWIFSWTLFNTIVQIL
jgi:hypothetical protein